CLRIFAIRRCQGQRNGISAAKIVEARVSAQLHAGNNLPSGLKLATVGDVLDDALVHCLGSRNLCQGQLETDQRDSLQHRSVKLKGKTLGSAFRIEVPVPGEFGVVPGIAKFAADKTE